MFKNKAELNAFLKGLKAPQTSKSLKLSKDELKSLRDDIYALILKTGDLPPKECLFLNELYIGAKLEHKKELDIYVDTANKYLPSLQTANEKLLFAELKSICLMLNSDKKSLLEYAKIVSCLRAGELSNTTDFIEFFNILFENISFDELYDICEFLYEPKRFLKLNSIDQKTILTNVMILYFNFPRIHVNIGFIRIYELMLVLFNNFVKNKNIDMAMYICTSMLHYLANVDPNSGERINEEVMKPLEKLYIEYAKNTNLPKPHAKKHKKIRVGFMRDKLTLNSPYKVEYSMMKALLADKSIADNYEFYLYSFYTPEKAEDNPVLMVEFMQLDVIFKAPAMGLHKQNKYLFNSLEKANIIRNEIINDEIDVLIDLCGNNAIANYIFTTRSAKKQIFFSHAAAEYDIKGIDDRVSHFAPTLNAKAKFNFKNLPVPMDVDKFYNPPVDKNLIKATKEMYPKDAFILGTIGRLTKIDDERYLKCVAQILKDNPNTIYLACGANGNLESIKAKLKKLGVSKRFYFPGNVEPHLYGHIIDLWLNTFPPNLQGESVNEYMAKGKPVMNIWEPKTIEISNAQIRDIKYNPNKLLIYIENLDNFNESVQYYDFIAKDKNIILINERAPKDKVLAKKCIIGNKKYADFSFEIKNKELFYITGFILISKACYKERILWQKQTRYPDLLEDKFCVHRNYSISEYCCAPGENGYIRKTSELVSDKSLIKTLGEYNAKLMKAIHSDNTKSLIKAFKDIAKSSK